MRSIPSCHRRENRTLKYAPGCKTPDTERARQARSAAVSPAMWHLRPSFLTPRPGTLSIRQVSSTHRGAFCAPPRTCEAGCAPCTGPCCPPLPLADVSGRSTAVCTPNAWYASGKPEDLIPPGEGAPDARRAPREEEERTAQRVHVASGRCRRKHARRVHSASERARVLPSQRTRRVCAAAA